jgi:hypothetical protein
MTLNAEKRCKIVARLQAAGIPISLVDHSAIRPDLVVESLKGSLAFDLKMGSEYLMNVKISNNSYGGLLVEELRGHLLEKDWELTFQGDPKVHDPGRKTYRMLSGRYVRYKSVLNHRLATAIAPGACIKGKLLALSITGEIPKSYPHGLSVPLELILTDQYGREHPSIIEVSVDRTATMTKPKPFTRVGRSLYQDSQEETPNFVHSFAFRPPVAKENSAESVKEQSELMKRITSLLQRPDINAPLGDANDSGGQTGGGT